MLLDDNGLSIAAFDPVFAAILGNSAGEEGFKVLGETIAHGRARVELRDFLYCLAKTAGTELRRRLIDAPGKRVETFVSGIESCCDDPEETGLPPDRLTAQAVTPAVLQMLESAERLANEHGVRVSDAILTLALLQTPDVGVHNGLTLWATEPGLKKFSEHLLARIGPPPEVNIFGPEGQLLVATFSPSGQRLCRRIVEDAASLGGRKITTRHLLYSLLGDDAGLLSVGLTVRGVDVKKELHAVLTRELTQPGRKRTEGLSLSRDTVFPAVEAILKEAGVAARRRGKKIAEFDVSRAFLATQAKELTRLFLPGTVFDLPALREYVEATEPNEEEEKSAKRFSVKQIEESMKKRVCGQEAAIDRVVPWVKRLRFGLPRDGRPAGVFLFLGPTGAGKTQLAKELAKYVYGDEEMLVFIEMGQFKTKESMSGFIGAPPGYIGYGEGKLTNGLRDKPESVVLFDEIEKADTQVFDVLLRFADEGLISDPAGPVRDGRKCIIVMTTNAGQAWLREQIKANPAIREDPQLGQMMFEAATDELRQKGFRPEFLGRVDERISFLPFTVDTCRKIVDGVLERDLEKFKKLKGILLDVPDPVRDFMANKAHERSMDEGARGAPRAVNEYIVTRAIDLLSDYETEDGYDGPTHLVASMVGLDKVVLEPAGAGGGAGIQQFQRKADELKV